jgi:hypothetical protein
MADTKISALTAASAAALDNELAINEAGTSKKVTADQLLDLILHKATGTSTAAGLFKTLLALSAASGSITGTTLTTIMTVTGVGVGTWHGRVYLVYQTTATTTGIDVAVNHSGTTTQWVNEIHYAGTGQLAATAAASEVAANAAGNVYEQAGGRTKNAIIGAGTVSVDAANTDMVMEIEFFATVTVSGNIEVKLAAEAASLVCTARVGTHIELTKVA